jgi:hypothetical protein
MCHTLILVEVAIKDKRLAQKNHKKVLTETF